MGAGSWLSPYTWKQLLQQVLSVQKEDLLVSIAAKARHRLNHLFKLMLP